MSSISQLGMTCGWCWKYVAPSWLTLVWHQLTDCSEKRQ